MRVINGTKQEIGSQLDALRQAIPLQLELYSEIAKLHKAYYNELVKAGFSKEEALHIVTVQGVGGNGQPSN
ncbi:hypothetical protein [Halalkalibacter krulwichiae]|uniref:Uncharacterized protein n=1 Tax=Halalkalibacter krulwichiae TaxID=199441 RepID=A0A1X9MM55_9BACI|nr:hypothetical protein [Halalkalibacter krulwichiae]ARK32152.1 hypothetical protein BkAM31D_21165 [Halalkalibacter krulwichiae]